MCVNVTNPFVIGQVVTQRRLLDFFFAKILIQKKLIVYFSFFVFLEILNQFYTAPHLKTIFRQARFKRKLGY